MIPLVTSNIVPLASSIIFKQSISSILQPLAMPLSPSANYSTFSPPLFAPKKKKRVITIRLVSTAGTGYFYVTRKNRQRFTHKLAFRKYDPRVNAHVLFVESKKK